MKCRSSSKMPPRKGSLEAARLTKIAASETPRKPACNPAANRRRRTLHHATAEGYQPGPALSGRFDLVELAPQDLDLVAQLGRVLEAEVVGGGQHLLLELHDRAGDLLRRHALLVRGAAAAPARPALRHPAAALLREEVGDVGDALLDALRRDAVVEVVLNLDRAAAVGLGDRLLHRRR